MSDPIQELEDKLNKVTDLRTKIDLLNELAWELRDTDPTRSRSLSETAYELATSDPGGGPVYPRGVITSLRGLAFSNRRDGNLALSLSQSTQALAYLESNPLPDAEADILQNIAILLGSLGNYAEGLEYGFKALNLAQSIGDRVRKAHILSSIAVIHLHSKNIDESLRVFRQALQLERELGDKRYEGQTLNNMSLSHNAQRNYKKALATSLEALRIAKENEFRGLIVTATGTVGETYLAMGEYTQASHYLQQYLAAARSDGSKRNEIWALMLLGETDQRQRHDDSAVSYLTQALDMARTVGLRAEEARCRDLLAASCEQQGDLKQALAHLRLLCQCNETIFNEDIAKRIANFQVLHQVETAKRDSEIHYLRTIELQKEIEERKNAQAALQELATTDPLTGLLNRREFFVLAEREFLRARRDNHPLSAVLLDLDHFKSINDTFGHAAGDQVLAATAKTGRDNLRQGELVARYGGDEMVILLPGSNLAKARQIAERLRERVSAQPIEIERGRVSPTVSLGIAELQANDTGLDVLLDHADQALYTAKRAGRNRAATYQDPT